MTAATAQKPDTQGRFKLYTVEELENLPDPAWLLEGVLPQGALAELYGPPGVGKSFLALDWALSVAAGGSRLGRPLNQADVVYVSAEGGTGLKKRVAAWRTKHPDADRSRFRAILEPINLRGEKEVKDVIKDIRQVECGSEPRFNPGLVVIDTLARCFGDGDENAAKDMNAFVAGADRIKDAFPQATVLVIHHTGKDTSRGERGSSALRGAADTVMELTANGKSKALTLKCEKQKDWEEFDNIPLSLQFVVLKDDETSCVIAARTVQTDGPEPDNDTDTKALKALRQFDSEGATYTDWLNASGLRKSTFKNARKRLLRDALVRHEGDCYRIANTNEGQGQGHAQSKPLALAS